MGKKRLLRRPLTIRDILAWARAHREATGKWPTKKSGCIVGAKFETWSSVDRALRAGLRGLAGGSSLPQLLAQELGARNIHDLPNLSEGQILHWADEHRERTGSWPTGRSKAIPGSRGETWIAIDNALRQGARGLPGGSSLAQLLAEHRGLRNAKQLPPLTEGQILQWADAFHEHTGTWPTAGSGPVAEAPGETWLAAHMALRQGHRGLAGGSSLPLLLADQRGVRNGTSLPNLTVPQILAWADAFHERTGNWPSRRSGPIPEAPGETWNAVDHALTRGSRGLPGGASLAELLAGERGVRNQSSIPNLSRKQILAWADAHQRRCGQWPTQKSGPITESPGDSWGAVDLALLNGSRGLRAGSSLARLLAQYRGKRNRKALPPLSKKKILAWADKHRERTGDWPNLSSGPVVDAPGEQWEVIDTTLRQGGRGLPPGSSLRKLLAKKRGVRHPLNLPPLTEEQILRWADLHFERGATWPKKDSGPIVESPGDTWAGINEALHRGRRRLTGGSSLAQLLDQNGRGRRLASASSSSPSSA
jgi:hypothetical protein